LLLGQFQLPLDALHSLLELILPRRVVGKVGPQPGHLLLDGRQAIHNVLL
jgi:hypothetical protein